MTTFPRYADRRVFVDTSAYYALADVRDEHHRSAMAIADRLARLRHPLLTTNFVVAEAHGLIGLRAGRLFATTFLDEIDGSGTTVLRAAARDELRAKAIVRHYADKDFSLTDAISFAVMERLRIPNAFTFDRHFEQFGFASIEPERT